MDQIQVVRAAGHGRGDAPFPTGGAKGLMPARSAHRTESVRPEGMELHPKEATPKTRCHEDQDQGMLQGEDENPQELYPEVATIQIWVEMGVGSDQCDVEH